MDKQTSLLEKIKNVLSSEKLSDVTKDESEVVESTEDVVDDAKAEVEDVADSSNEAEETSEETTDATSELVEALEKATNKIEEVQAENAELKDQLAKALEERDEKAKVANKAESIVNRLNNLLKDTDAEKVIMSNQKQKKKHQKDALILEDVNKWQKQKHFTHKMSLMS